MLYLNLIWETNLWQLWRGMQDGESYTFMVLCLILLCAIDDLCNSFVQQNKLFYIRMYAFISCKGFYFLYGRIAS